EEVLEDRPQLAGDRHNPGGVPLVPGRLGTPHGQSAAFPVHIPPPQGHDLRRAPQPGEPAQGVDADFRIQLVNPIALPVFGAIPGGVVGRDLGEIMHILWEASYADEVVGIFRRTLDTGETYATPARAEFRADC